MSQKEKQSELQVVQLVSSLIAGVLLAFGVSVVVLFITAHLAAGGKLGTGAVDNAEVVAVQIFFASAVNRYAMQKVASAPTRQKMPSCVSVMRSRKTSTCTPSPIKFTCRNTPVKSACSRCAPILNTIPF